MSFAKRFVGVENLPTRLSKFDVQQAFCMIDRGVALNRALWVLAEEMKKLKA